MVRSSDRSALIDGALDRRTVAEIRRRVSKQSERNAVSRLIHAKNDKDAIAAWRLDLNRVLQVFTVRSAAFTRLSLIVPFQTELVVNTHTLVLDLHRNALSGQEGASGRHPSVSVTFYPSIRECSPPPRFKQGQLPRIFWRPRSYFRIASLLENYLLHGRGRVSDAMS